MKPSDPEAPAPIVTWTVWLHPQYHFGNTEVWTGSEYSKALSVAMEVVGVAETVQPVDHNWTAAARVAGERTTNSWRITTADDDEPALVFITTASTQPTH